MNLIRSIPNLSTIHGPLHLAIGVFDGVHPGHQAVIEHALADARTAGGQAVVVTFDPHPQRVIRPEAAPLLLTCTRHKIDLLRDLGVAHLLLVHFDHEFSRTAPEDFVRALAASSRPLKGIVVGREWTFGRDRAGNVVMLKKLGRELGFTVVTIPPVTFGEQTVSSTAIRQALQNSDLDMASRLLGRPFSVLGVVEHGDHLGTKLGFPTANLDTRCEQFPPDGVYAVTATFGGNVLPGVVNVGVRPTISSGTGTRKIEVHLLDFRGGIYGEEVEVVFHERLRGEEKFDGLESLRAQIRRDIARTREVLSARGWAIPMGA